MLERVLTIGEKRFYMYQEVIVIKILSCFHLAKVQELSQNKSVWVDICTLTSTPDFTTSISIEFFGGIGK